MATVEQRPLPAPSGVGSTAARWPERLYVALNVHGGLMLAAQLAMYFVAAFSLAAIKPFWFDELITFNIARQQSPAAIWQLLLHAADPNPPLSHLLTAFSMRMFGSSEIAVRLPEICAGAVTIICIYQFLVRRLPAVYAVAGVFFFLTTHALDYSYEARSYAFLLCFSAMALLAWRATHESHRQFLAALLLAASLAAGVSSNYYGVLIFFAIAAGEVASSIQRRDISWRVWLALAAGAAPMLAYLPLIHAAEARFSPYAWNKPYPEFVLDAYTAMLDASLWLALAAVYTVVVIAIYERISLGVRRAPILRAPEFVAVSVIAGFPVLGYLLALMHGGMVAPRFVVPMCVGVAIAVGVAAFKILGRSPSASLLFLLGCLCWFAYHCEDIGGDYNNQREALKRIIINLPIQGAIVVPDSLLATTLHHYATPELAQRLVFPMDMAAIRQFKREDSAEQNLAAAPQLYSLPIVPLDSFRQGHSAYYVLSPDDNWLLQYLREQDASVHRVPLDFRSHNLKGFTPLAFHDVSLFRVVESPGNNRNGG